MVKSKDLSLSPSNLRDALKLTGHGFIPVAGGTDLMVKRHASLRTELHMNTGVSVHKYPPLFYTGKIPELSELKSDCTRITAGSNITLSNLIDYENCPELLRQALLSIASPGIRNIATLAGNICNASPAADSLPALYLLDTRILCVSLNADKLVYRTVPLEEFITGPGKTTLNRGELVYSVSFSHSSGSFVYRKVGTRAANALSKVSIAAIWETADGVVQDFRLAVGACGPVVIRSLEAEALLRRRKTSELRTITKDIRRIYFNLLRPIDDQRSTADYRKNTALNIIEDILLGMEG